MRNQYHKSGKNKAIKELKYYQVKSTQRILSQTFSGKQTTKYQILLLPINICNP